MIRRRVFLGMALAAAPLAARAQSPAAAPPVETVNPGQLTVVFSPAAPPTAFIQNGQPTGMAIDLITEAARRIGLTPVFRAQADLAGALPAISNRQYDVAAMGIMRTPEREAVVDFTRSWYYGWFPLVVQRDSGIQGYEGLQGRIAGVVRGSIQERYMRENHPGIRLMAFPDEVGMITALNARSVDAILMGSAQLGDAIRRFPSFAAVARTPTPYPNAFPLRKGNASLRAALDNALAAMVADGTYVRIHDRWHPNDPLPEPMYQDYPGLDRQRAPGVAN